MTEQVAKYMAQNARIFCVSLSDAVVRSGELNEVSGETLSILGKLEAFACCIAALQKNERASVIVHLSLAGVGSYSATADRDGIVRGRPEEGNSSEDTLEVTLQLPIRGNYTGVVTGHGLDDLVATYFSQSLQIASACRVFESNGAFFCIVAEQLPGVSCDLEGLCAAASEQLPQGNIPVGFEFLESMPFRFGCTCSRAALMRFVDSLSEADRADLAEDGRIITYCNACGKKYTFEL
ncbi:MAG: Hsp33 family molecular chaperone HslO [Clostridia bacterium]|nr:Hsp33 family molecular chaperone HslO [Clostridia bacterium]